MNIVLYLYYKTNQNKMCIECKPKKWTKADYELANKHMIQQAEPIKIISTDDYTLFKVNAWTANRMIQKQIDRMCKSIKTHGWIKGSCIKVDEEFNVIDGYYRLYAAMRCWIPVQYVMIKTGPKK